MTANEPKGNSGYKFRNLLQSSLLSLISVALTLGLLEIVFRQFTPVLGPLYQHDPVTIYSLKPNLSVTHTVPGDFRVHYSTNSLGFRDTEIVDPEPAEKCRILGLGDSFTMGSGVEEDETYLSILEAKLNNPSPAQVEVINAGVAGWGTSHELELLSDSGSFFKPDLVLVGFYPNDIEDSLRSGLYRLGDNCGVVPVPYEERPAYYPEKEFITNLPLYNFLASNSALFNWVRGTYTRMRAPATQATDTIPLECEGGNDSPLNFERQLMQRMLEATSDLDADLIFIIMPPSPLHHRPRLANVDDVLSICNDEAFQCLDLRPAFEESGLQLEELYYRHDIHWRPATHEIAAQAIFAYLKEHNLPDCSRPSDS